MAAENVPASTQSDGRWRVTNVPIAANAKSVAILNGVTAKPITYGLTPDGWDHQSNQATVVDKRLTMIQDLSRPGKVTETLNMKVVQSTSADSADQILKALSISGVESQFVVRRGVANADTHAVAQTADILTGIVGIRRPDAPTENGVDTAQYALFITKPTEPDVALVA